ncbi:body wall muscle protein HR-29-like [Littorina saxatilis]|uniref:SHSP domain-containing protein n=1 Tax=Littorina saxatilis TaxID=31220 RepID=A0AAN9G7R1_9CAEN
MALEKILAPSVVDTHFFDDIFEDVNREVYRMHHDLRQEMQRLTPRDPISAAGDSLEKHLKTLRDSVVSKEDGSQEFRFNVDLNAFKPEEINVTIKGNAVSIGAKHEDKSDKSSVMHAFSRSFTLPEGVDPENLTCSLSKDGVMTVKGPVDTPALDGPPEKKQKTIKE